MLRKLLLKIMESERENVLSAKTTHAEDDLLGADVSVSLCALDHGIGHTMGCED